VRQVTPAHVLDIVKGIDDRAPEMAALVKRCIGAVCRLAVSTLRADLDPAAPLSGALKPRKVRHNRPLSEDELKQFVQVLDKLERHPTTKYALRLTLLTLARSCEVLGARWDEIDLEGGTWIIPASRMKMREAHAIPLPSQAVEMLKKIHADTGHREHLFPNRDDPKRHVSDSILRTAVRGIGLPMFSPHGIRSTGSTMLNSMGFRADLIEKQLAHEERNRMRATYNRADYLPERREMMQLWANYLNSLAVGSEKVVPLRQNAA